MAVMGEVSLPKLPPRWARATIPDLVAVGGVFSDGDWVETKDQDPKGGVRLIQLADIGDGTYRNRSQRYLTREKAGALRCTFLKPGDTLIARMPDPLGRACIFPGDSKPSVTVVDVCIVRTGENGAGQRWLMNAVNSTAFRAGVAELQSGTTRKRISRKNLAKLGLPVPPLPEQRRIVAKIEELFSNLDEGVDALKRAREQLKRYRQAVLKAAFEGKLTDEWRKRELAKPDSPLRKEPASLLLERIKVERGKAEKGKKRRRKELPPLDTSELPELPEGWVWTTVGDLCAVVTGTTPSKKRPEYYGGDVPFYKPTDLNAGYHVKDAAEKLSAEGAENARVLPAGSTLVTCIGATIGKTGFIRKGGASNQQINAIPATRHLVPGYVFFVAISPQFQSMILANASSTTLPILNKGRFEALPLPLPPLTEQRQMVSEVERSLSIADSVDQNIDQGLKRSARLRQSILKRAFEGKLVAQDPSDEPAEKLLERIRAEREAKAAAAKAAKRDKGVGKTKKNRRSSRNKQGRNRRKRHQ